MQQNVQLDQLKISGSKSTLSIIDEHTKIGLLLNRNFYRMNDI